MGWALALLALVWIGIAAAVTAWALRARREQRSADQAAASRPPGLLLVDRIDVVDLTDATAEADEIGGAAGRL